jgi:hypothetical protein
MIDMNIERKARQLEELYNKQIHPLLNITEIRVGVRVSRISGAPVLRRYIKVTQEIGGTIVFVWHAAECKFSYAGETLPSAPLYDCVSMQSLECLHAAWEHIEFITGVYAELTSYNAETAK